MAIIPPSMRRALVPALAVSVAVGGPAVPAAAQDGVHLDPNSPAGKEYSVPLEKARREALGQTPSGSRGSADALAGGSTLFGKGIKRVSASRAGGSADGGGAGSGGRSGKGGSADGASAGAPLSAGAAAPKGSGAGTSILLAAGALLGAGGLGFLLRRALRSG